MVWFFFGGDLLLIKVQISLMFSIIALSSYSLITRNVDYSSYTLFLLGALVLFLGIEKLRNDRKIRGYVCILVALFVLLVSLQGFCN
ncbi:DUF3953 domain-containing protein [Peribacillus butanolivorans]|uniref:DUF3953 domain-containing protein n=2 Tax=Peribacillus butanolivorans TaxID=421767 RepID=UPI0036C0CED6